MRALALLLFFLAFSQACRRKWTEEKKAELEAQCESIDTLDGSFSFSLDGFNYPEIDTILVTRFKGTDSMASFYVHPDPHMRDSLRRRHDCEIGWPVDLRQTYRISIPGQKAHFISQMKMQMHPQFTKFSEGYGCTLGDCLLDSVKTERCAIIIKKEGFQYNF